MSTDAGWVRLVFVDVFGAAHAVLLPASQLDTAVANGVPFDGSALEGRARHLESDMLLRPDASTIVDLGGGVARAACTVLGPDGEPWAGDPRTSLMQAVSQLDDLASAWRAAAELEFYLLQSDGSPTDRATYFSDVEGLGADMVRDVADQLCGYGVEVLSCHHEAGPGQFELDFASMAPMALADALVLAKQVLRQSAATAGYRVTFMARPFSEQPGSGLHLHQRVDGALLDIKGHLDDDGKAFVAGQLSHARGLSALAAPNVNSYKRLHSGAEAPSAIVWAHVNRAALIRVGSSAGHDPTIEFRGADPSANPYLLMVGLLASAAHRLENRLELAPPFEEDLAGFDPSESASVRLQPLPRDLDGALDALLADDVLVDAFDSRLLARLVDGRRAEAEAFRSHVTTWELGRYLDES
jgi:glutamine synthetase